MSTPQVFGLLGVLVVLVVLYTYMYKRMGVMLKGEKDGTYTSNMKRSLVELVIFVIIYFGSAAIATLPAFNLQLTLVGGMVAFLLSLFIFNRLLFEKMGKVVPVFATVFMTAYYLFLAYVNINS